MCVGAIFMLPTPIVWLGRVGTCSVMHTRDSFGVPATVSGKRFDITGVGPAMCKIQRCCFPLYHAHGSLIVRHSQFTVGLAAILDVVTLELCP